MIILVKQNKLKYFREILYKEGASFKFQEYLHTLILFDGMYNGLVYK